MLSTARPMMPSVVHDCFNVSCLLCGCDQVTSKRLVHTARSLSWRGNLTPSFPPLTSRVLCNIEVRSYLSSKIANFVSLKVDFWPWR